MFPEPLILPDGIARMSRLICCERGGVTPSNRRWVRSANPVSVGSALIIVAMALVLAACGSAADRSPGIGSSPPLCRELEAVHAERAQLGDAFRSAFGGQLDEAATAASGIRGRLTALMGSLPGESGDGSLREAVVAEALLVHQAAGWINDGLGGAPDLRTIVEEGRAALQAGDAEMRRLDAWAVAGPCAGLALVIDEVVFPEPPPTPAAIDFGIPEKIGSAQLRVSPQDISPDGVLADAIRAAGGDPRAAAGVHVAILDGVSEPSFDALLVPGVSLDGFATALQASLWQQATVRTETTVVGWRLIRLATPPDWLAGPERFAVTQRGQVFYTFGDLMDAQLTAILAAIGQK